ncbi:MAG: DUF4127 family protein [Anaerolineae bacterium]|nr:DUF4127 family protein [Anaerolineae bacterium]
MHIGLIPLDERPANMRYPAMIAQIAGVDLHMPPLDRLSYMKRPADGGALVEWVQDAAAGLDALIVSCEMLGYGSLVASRTTNEPAAAILARLDALRAVKRRYPNLYIAGVNVITRISNANAAAEEPPYWERLGTRFYRFSQLLDRAGDAELTELAALRAELPAEYAGDFLRRRLRNHTVNLAAVHLLAEGVFDLLALSSDDTSPYGLPSREKRWLAGWAELLAPGDRLLMYPGADEVGCALLMRLVNRRRGYTPRFLPYYAVPGGEQIVAPYEDGPIMQTVERQIRAVGGVVAEDGDYDIWLAVNTPVERGGEWHPAHAAAERAARRPHLQKMVEAIQAHGAVHTVIADVAYPNGADPVLIDLLREQVDLPALAAYGGWNTAGNTIGVALAQGCAAHFAERDAQRAVQARFLLHRFVEDWGYQHVVRAQVREWLMAQTGNDEPAPDQLDDVRAWVEARLRACIDELPGFAGRYHIAPGSARLPWQRTFEVDFDLCEG